MESLTGIVPDTWLAWLTALVTLCAAVTTALPPPGEHSGPAYKAMYRILQWIALNFGRAKNANDPAARKTVPDDGKR